MHPVIQVEGLSKAYRIGLKESMPDTFMGAAASWIKAPLRNLQRLRSLDVSSRSHRDNPAEDCPDILWALNHVSLDVHEGEMVGVIGGNGAGKSTLLKILSRITKPTSGRAMISGRIGSLLEVGTGFHPELTGRENVYLNGTILGMTRREIDRKFDEIVEFSGVERFLDTPTKRYSSGMQVRLAFAVAAHLEPEILIIDEVLAVGDASFQKKCLGKMGDIASEGRTVLFVSHNMEAVENLCSRAVLLDQGRLVYSGPTRDVIDRYMDVVSAKARLPLAERADRRGEGKVQVVGFQLLNETGGEVQYPAAGEPLTFRLFYRVAPGNCLRHCYAAVAIVRNDTPYFVLATDLVDTAELCLEGEGFIDLVVPELPLSESTYLVDTFIQSNQIVQDWVRSAFELTVIGGDFYGTGRSCHPGWQGRGVLVRHHCRHVPGIPSASPCCAPAEEVSS